MPDGVIGKDMRRVFRIEVADDPDFAGLHANRIRLKSACVKSNVVIWHMKKFEPSIPAMRLVLAIVKAGKLTTAASRLRISQSGASHALRALEAQVGATLFIRDSQGLHLSEAGQRLLPYMEQALADLDAMRAAAAGLSQLKTGNLRVAAVPSLLASILPPMLKEYGDRFPGIDLSVFEGTDDEVRTWVASGLAHVGFSALPVEGLAAEEIARDEWLALIPVDLFPDESGITLRQLAQHKFLMSGGGCELHIQRIFAAAHIALPDPLTVKQLPTIQAMVADKLGVSLVPSLSVMNTHRGSRALHLKPRLFRRIGMLRATGSISTPALEAWLSLARGCSVLEASRPDSTGASRCT
jgi:DNA-binding transcriptional LysR family regulator